MRLIRRYLQAGLFEGGLATQRVQGTPQGGPLSPLPSNVLLDEMDESWSGAAELALDQWIRLRLRCLLWRKWKRPRTRAKKLLSRGLPRETAWIYADNGRGPWWNARSKHLHRALPARYFHTAGLVSLLQSYRRLARPT